MKRIMIVFIMMVSFINCAIKSKEEAQKYSKLQTVQDKFSGVDSAETVSLNLMNIVGTPSIFKEQKSTSISFSIIKNKKNDANLYSLRLSIKNEGKNVDWIFPSQGKSLVLLIDGKKYELELIKTFSGDVKNATNKKIVLEEQALYSIPEELVKDLAIVENSIEFKLIGKETTILSTIENYEEYKKQNGHTSAKLDIDNYTKFRTQASAENILNY